MGRLLSYSQVNTFVACPYKWHLSYVRGWRPKEKAEALVLGSVLHEDIAEYLRCGAWVEVDPDRFSDFTDGSRDSRRDIHLAGMATNMLRTWISHFQPMLEGESFVPHAVEDHVYKGGFHGYVDCVAGLPDATVALVDWKTTSRPYREWRAHNDDQLTAYAWLVQGKYDIDEVAFVTLQKPSGRIEWHRSTRTQEQIDGFAQKVNWVRGQMERGAAHRNPGMGCGWCSFLRYCAYGEDLGVRNERDDF